MSKSNLDNTGGNLPTWSKVFDSWSEWCEYVADDSPNPHGRRSESRDKAPRPEWDLNTTFKAAQKLASTGWDEPMVEVNRFAEHVEANMDTDLFQTSFESRFDVAGAEVAIDRFLSGEPECMIESTPIRISRQGRAVRLVVTGGALAEVEAENIRNRGAAIVALADVLARCQHPVEIWVGWQVKIGDKHLMHAVKVQNANDPLDVPRLLFAIAHPACHRRLTFRARELCPDRWHNASSQGYGATEGVHAASLPDEVENTIYLGPIRANDEWSEARACAWIQGEIDKIFA